MPDKTCAIRPRNGKATFSKTCNLRTAYGAQSCSNLNARDLHEHFFPPSKKPCQFLGALQTSADEVLKTDGDCQNKRFCWGEKIKGIKC